MNKKKYNFYATIICMVASVPIGVLGIWAAIRGI